MSDISGNSDNFDIIDNLDNFEKFDCSDNCAQYQVHRQSAIRLSYHNIRFSIRQKHLQHVLALMAAARMAFLSITSYLTTQLCSQASFNSLDFTLLLL